MKLQFTVSRASLIFQNRFPDAIYISVKECEMSRVMRKPDFCICENKDADQLRGNREADQRLCFCYTAT